MKFILFCNLPYAFSILKPLEQEIIKRGYDFLWYLPSDIENSFAYKNSNYTTSIKDLINYKSDVIFVPGNDVPHFLHGIKVQIFHGLAGEKKGHFKIRNYFDLYLTQGPYFTNKFKDLAKKYKNFEVTQTGWCKLDNLYQISKETKEIKENLLKKHNVKKIILYAPTFSPSLTSAPKLIEIINNLSKKNDILVIVKFHDKIDKHIEQKYINIQTDKLIISNEKDITKLLQISDLMISDTSSVVYEFILLNKPVVTLNSNSKNINWLNIKNVDNFENAVMKLVNNDDEYFEKRKKIIKMYHPYSDSKSSQRMVDAVIKYKEKNSVPTKRKLSLLRKFKIYKKYGKID